MPPTMTPTAMALADAYRDWFGLVAEEAAGRLPAGGDVAATWATIRAAERMVPDPDAVYRVVVEAWTRETGCDPLTGRPVATP